MWDVVLIHSNTSDGKTVISSTLVRLVLKTPFRNFYDTISARSIVFKSF